MPLAYIENPIEMLTYYIEYIDSKLWLFLGSDNHKIKKKAEQSACKKGYELLTSLDSK